MKDIKNAWYKMYTVKSIETNFITNTKVCLAFQYVDVQLEDQLVTVFEWSLN